MAIAGISTAIGRGVEVPSQRSVTSFDDAPLSAYLQPALTTVRTDNPGWGRAAGRQLLAAANRQDDRPINIRLCANAEEIIWGNATVKSWNTTPRNWSAPGRFLRARL
jgi:DNA-binding LacI/PurR family transcriptional regulator